MYAYSLEVFACCLKAKTTENLNKSNENQYKPTARVSHATFIGKTVILGKMTSDGKFVISGKL